MLDPISCDFHIRYFFRLRIFKIMSSKESCKEAVFNYLSSQNRPYSANDIIQNLHKEFGKTAVQKALDDLTLELKVKEKAYGKQKVYAVVQEDESELEAAESFLGKMELDIGEVTEKLKAAEQELKQREHILNELENEPTTEAAFKEKSSLKEIIEKLSEKINNFSNSAFGITDEDKNKIHNNSQIYNKEYRKRKQSCMDIINSILENYPKKVKVLLDEIGVEVDGEK